jgi:hypothetical protein
MTLLRISTTTKVNEEEVGQPVPSDPSNVMANLAIKTF